MTKPIEKLPNPFTDYDGLPVPSRTTTSNKINEIIERVNTIEAKLDKLLNLLEITIKE